VPPSRATAKPRIGVVVSSTAEPAPVATSHRHSVPSDDDENTVRPSWVNSTCVIKPRWPRSISRGRSARARSSIEPSALGTTTCSPSADAMP